MEIPGNCGGCGYCEFSDTSPDNSRCSHPFGNEVVIKDQRYKHPDCPLDSDVLEGERYLVKFQEENLYVTIGANKGKPVEVFMDHPIKGDPNLSMMMSSWDTITRLLTMALKTHPLEKVLEQLDRSSREKSDIPGILADKLRRFSK